MDNKSKSKRKDQHEDVAQGLIDFQKKGVKKNEDYLLTKILRKIPLWIYAMGLGLVCLTSVCFFISSMVIYYYGVQTSVRPLFGTNQAPGQPCSSTGECVNYAYCSFTSSSSVGTCVCGTLYYYDSAISSTACTARKSYSTACSSSTECQEVYGLICSATCVCPSTKYWNTTALECQYFIPVNGLCDTSYLIVTCADSLSTCATITGTSGARCLCNTNYIFNPTTSACTLMTQQNAVCSATSDCITYAYCGIIAGDTVSKCWCDTLYAYKNSACIGRQDRSGSCVTSATTYYEQCNTNYYNLACFSGSCDCDSTYQFWDSNYKYCFSLKRYSQTCTSTSDCITTAPYALTCLITDFGTVYSTFTSATRKICRCDPATQYFDEVLGQCKNYKGYRQICAYRRECLDSDFVHCEIFGGGTTTRCECIPNLSYYDSASNKCVKKGTTCTSSNTQCYDYAGYICNNPSCGCDTTTKWTDASGNCQWLKRTFDYCTASTECKSGTCTSNACA